ncbi:unnamed protein product, partial [Schistosoma curassoni]|uniref:Uncharacterized protein n=1 Tax=Schistosoma curassoni TaxID=6186 RepID=A0A183K7R0_9TREM
QTRSLIRSKALSHSNRNFSSHVGFNSCRTVLVRLRTLPTCTVTYGSLRPVLSLPIKP